MNNEGFNLQPVWDAILEIYMEISRLCDRHGLRYYLTDGSAIGAVRHKGFIPWDDDLDLSMPREDYMRFVELARTELPPYLRFLDWHNVSDFTLLFGKVQDIRKEKVLEVERQCGYMLSSGLYVDIIPIDGYPKSCIERFLTKIVVGVLSCIVRYKCMSFGAQTNKGRFVWLVGLLFSLAFPFVTDKRCKEFCEKQLLRHPFKDSEITGRASLRLTLLNRKPIPKKIWGRCPSMHEFQGLKVPLPQDFDSYLRFYYGDYMKLPPESKRVPSHEYRYRCSWWLGAPCS